MTKVVGVIQARLTSIRLARKAVLPLAGRPVIHHLFDRAQAIEGLDDLVLAIPEGEAHDPIAEATAAYPHIKVVRGPNDDLIVRYIMAADQTGADVFVRMWGDCPVTDPKLATGLLQLFLNSDATWAFYPPDSGYPEGVETQVIDVKALRAVEREATHPLDREGLVDLFKRHPGRFPGISVRRQPDRSHLKCLLDTEQDYERISQIFDILYPHNPMFTLADLETLAKTRPDLFDRNAAFPEDNGGAQP